VRGHLGRAGERPEPQTRRLDDASNIYPIVTIVLALIFLGELVSLLESAGLALAILSAIALAQEIKPVAQSGR